MSVTHSTSSGYAATAKFLLNKSGTPTTPKGPSHLQQSAGEATTRAFLLAGAFKLENPPVEFIGEVPAEIPVSQLMLEDAMAFLADCDADPLAQCMRDGDVIHQGLLAIQSEADPMSRCMRDGDEIQTWLKQLCKENIGSN
jgi:hypothetical protein